MVQMTMRVFRWKGNDMARPTYNNGRLIQLGDRVKAFSHRHGFWHHGIVAMLTANGFGNGFAITIIHNDKGYGVIASSFFDFASGQPVAFVAAATSESHRHIILNRAWSNLGKPYQLFAQNCEHFVTFAYNGVAESETVGLATLLAGLGLALVAVSIDA